MKPTIIPYFPIHFNCCCKSSRLPLSHAIVHSILSSDFKLLISDDEVDLPYYFYIYSAFFYFFQFSTTNSASPFSTSLFKLIFLSAISFMAGKSESTTLAPSAAKYMPSNPTPLPNSNTVLPLKLIEFS